MEVRWATFLVGIAFVDSGVNGTNSATSRLTRWTRCLLWTTWASGDRIIIHITILIELNWFAWALSTNHLIKWWLCILSSSLWHHTICILCIQSSTNSRFDDLVSRILLLRILLIDNILLELSWLLLRWVLVCLFQRNLLDIHLLLLHSTLTNYRCLIWIEPRFLLIIHIRWLDYYTSDIWAIFKWIISSYMSSYNRFCTRVFRLLCFWVNAKSIIIWLLLLRSFLSLHLFVESFTLLEYLHQFCINLVTVQLLKNVLLMLKLILWLFCLFSSHLLL